jgi:hypothetical protein
MCSRRQLCRIKGLSEAKVEKLKEAAQQLLVSERYVVLLAY